MSQFLTPRDWGKGIFPNFVDSFYPEPTLGRRHNARSHRFSGMALYIPGPPSFATCFAHRSFLDHIILVIKGRAMRLQILRLLYASKDHTQNADFKHEKSNSKVYQSSPKKTPLLDFSGSNIPFNFKIFNSAYNLWDFILLHDAHLCRKKTILLQGQVAIHFDN